MRRFAPLALLFACNGLASIEATDLAELTPTERAQVDLGRALFFDPGLSGAGDVSCSTCHDPELHGTDGLPTSIGTGGAALTRNAPSVLNAALKRLQFWDGRAETLEAQAEGPLFAADEMGQTPEGLVTYVRRRWADELRAAFPGERVGAVSQVTRALAAYQQTLPTPSRFDAYLNGDREALDPLEQDGLRLFRNNCAFCHGGDGIGGDRLRRLGDEVAWPNQADLGRFEVTGDPDDRMVFVVPSLRNVSLTAPYFHDGSVETLDEAVRLMGEHQLGETLPNADVQALVAFLGSLEATDLPPWAFAP